MKLHLFCCTNRVNARWVTVGRAASKPEVLVVDSVGNRVFLWSLWSVVPVVDAVGLRLRLRRFPNGREEFFLFRLSCCFSRSRSNSNVHTP